MNSYGWGGSTQEFLALSEKHFLESLSRNIYSLSIEEAWSSLDEKILSQLRAWSDCFRVLQNVLKEFANQSSYLLFEYSILRGSGRRPDVLLFLPGEILVMEFKMYKEVSAAEFTQTSLYVRDLQNYHSVVQQHQIHISGVLVPTSSKETRILYEEGPQIFQASPKSLPSLVCGLIKRNDRKKLVTLEEFIEGDYAPLPSIIESAKAILRDEDLPQIKAIKSSNFDHVISEVNNIIQYAQQNHSHHLVLVSGVPGAGKTFVGLKLAHEKENAVYLSGNGPLVEVLQDSLQNRTFVQSLYGYKREYLNHGRIPKEQVIIFDEAQRAWDSKKMGGSLSEADVIIQIAKHQKSWSVVIGLIGEGQEIHLGEEGGLELWNTAIKNQQIHVHSKHVYQLFTSAHAYYQNENLHLNCSLRTHEAINYFDFVNKLLENDIKGAAAVVHQLKKSRYTLRVTDDLEKAKAFVSRLYRNDSKTYGIVCSTGNDRGKVVPVVPFGNRYEVPKPVVAYFNYPESTYYCKKLEYAATEFQTQGLELDIAIVHWDQDLYWEDNQWKSKFIKKDAQDPLQMKLNAYRVLLTRGRDGTIIYVPPHIKAHIQSVIKSLRIAAL